MTHSIQAPSPMPPAQAGFLWLPVPTIVLHVCHRTSYCPFYTVIIGYLMSCPHRRLGHMSQRGVTVEDLAHRVMGWGQGWGVGRPITQLMIVCTEVERNGEQGGRSSARSLNEQQRNTDNNKVTEDIWEQWLGWVEVWKLRKQNEIKRSKQISHNLVSIALL